MLLIIQKQICPNVSCLPIPLYFCPSFCITQNNCYAVANPCRPNQLCRFTHGNTDIIAIICCKDGSFWHIIQSAAARIFLCILFWSSFIAIFCRRFWLLALSFFLLFLFLFFFLLLFLLCLLPAFPCLLPAFPCPLPAFPCLLGRPDHKRLSSP